MTPQQTAQVAAHPQLYHQGGERTKKKEKRRGDDHIAAQGQPSGGAPGAKGQNSAQQSRPSIQVQYFLLENRRPMGLTSRRAEAGRTGSVRGPSGIPLYARARKKMPFF